MNRDRARRITLSIWLLGSGSICGLICAICLFGTVFRGIESTVWLWVAATYLPTLLLMLGWVRKTASVGEAPRGKSPCTIGCPLAVLFYLFVAGMTILGLPFVSQDYTRHFQLSYFWLVPLQAVVAAYLSLSLSEPVRQDRRLRQSSRVVSIVCVPLLITSLSLLAFRILSWRQSVLWLLFALMAYPPIVAISRAESISGANIVQLYQSGVQLIVQLFGLFSRADGRKNILIVQGHNMGDINMGNEIQGDHIEVSGGQVASIGRNNEVHDITMTSVQDAKPLDLAALSQELSLLRTKVKEELREKESAGQDTSEHEIALGSITAARAAAENGDESGARKNLAAAGKWALDLATKVGASLATDILKKELGLK